MHYPTVGMPDISRFIVTPFFTYFKLFQALPQLAFEYRGKEEECALLHLIHAINNVCFIVTKYSYKFIQGVLELVVQLARGNSK